MFHQARHDERTVFELSSPGRRGLKVPAAWGKCPDVPENLRRDDPPELPEMSVREVVRHYVVLSQMNYGVDSGIYPLGSCTMKFNPKLGEAMAASDHVMSHHPHEAPTFVQGNLAIMHELAAMLACISGTDVVTLQPAAGAHAEFLGAKIIDAFHRGNGDERDEMLVPDTAHGTNPASSAMAGFKVVEIPSGPDGQVDIDALRAAVGSRTAGLMLTNPNTLGIYEERIGAIAGIVHDAGGLLYYDGANLNALIGQATPGDMGFDIVHFNLHKTFSTPHGGGGPGAGAIGVKSFLKEYLPAPLVVQSGDEYALSYDIPKSVGRVRQHHGNFAVMVRAYAYLLSLGSEIGDVSYRAVVNSNYLMTLLKDEFEVPFITKTPHRMHEFVVSCEKIRGDTGVTALDIARRLLDYGVHAPTVYFPQVVKEALMIEPTETEEPEMLEAFADILIRVKQECYDDPDMVKGAPYNTARRKLDLYKATKTPVISWMMRER
ncbi:glycine dehydrogenase subunit 2 [archaeon]|nr:MAG: glycine dehydrogenase subunit 2 [archaeon]